MNKLTESKKIYFELLKWRELVFAPIAKWLTDKGVKADKITFFRLLLILPMVWLVGYSELAAFLVIVLNIVLDGLDGAVARRSKTTSVKGRTFDVCVDNFYVVPLILALIWFNKVTAFWAALYLINILVDYFLKFLKYGIKIEKYPFFWSRYFVYLSLFLLGLTGINWFDYVLIFWSITILIVNANNLFLLYKGRWTTG